jgi:hypothetical protein
MARGTWQSEEGNREGWVGYIKKIMEITVGPPENSGIFVYK